MLTHVASGSVHRFHHTAHARASPDAFFRVWTDVGAWPRWDDALEWAELDGPMRLGAKGRLKSRGSPPAPFEVVRYEPGRGYAFATALPLGRLVVDRSMAADGEGVRFTHDVRFEGLGGWLLGWVLGPGFRRALPEVMAALRAQLEAAS